MSESLNTSHRSTSPARLVRSMRAGSNTRPLIRKRISCLPSAIDISSLNTTRWTARGAEPAAYFGASTDQVAGKDLKLTGTKIGTKDGPLPIAAVFHPTRNLIYFPWAKSREVKVYNTRTWKEVGSFDFENDFVDPRFWSFVSGREKLSADGSLLFVTVDGGVRYVDTTGVR